MEVYFGLSSPSKLQRTQAKGKYLQGITSSGGWSNSAPNTSHSDFRSFDTVGVVIPGDYYSYKDVVKLQADHDYKDMQTSPYKDLVYTLPTDNNVTAVTTGCHNVKAASHAVFDILMQNEDSYWIQYKSSDGKVIGTKDNMQHKTFDGKDKEEDKLNPIGHSSFNWLKDGKSISSVEFIAHRDMLSADNVSTSLAVSGYMAKYASYSNTYNYLTFMKNAGFTFRGLDTTSIDQITADASSRNSSDTDQSKTNAPKINIDKNEANRIAHENRVVWIANAAKTSDLSSSKNGINSREYNTDYVGGINGAVKPDQRQQCHFGLGGLAADGADIFALIKDNNLGDLSLDRSNTHGDASRSIYYFATFSEGSNASCHGLDMGDGEDSGELGCSEGAHGSHTCSHKVDKHTTPHNTALASCLSGNNYVAWGADIFISNMRKNETHSSLDIQGGNQRGAIESIEASRLAFEIPLAVEGTTAGQFHGAHGENGLTYKPTNSSGRFVDDYSLQLNNKNELTLVAPDDQEGKTWTENTFRVKESHYQDLGSSKGESLVAEYHFSTPTRDFTFNPSYYMLFDDDFADSNKSVWMLSEQPRTTNFKDILAVRLTNKPNGNTNAGPSDNAYSTHLSSAWSTDLADTQCHNKTQLPVAKAGNAVKATVDKSGGTVTMYVVLQDPDFTADPKQTENLNKSIMDSYQKQADAILKQFSTAANSNGASMTASASSFGMAMYSNVTNLSSKNSGYRVTGIPVGGQSLLDAKEPMKLSTSDKLTYKVTTGNKGNSSDIGNWSFYALAGYEVNSIGSEAQADISDTTSAGKRKYMGQYVIKSSNKATGHQKKVLDELNDRLCMLMVPQSKDYSESLNPPVGTQPYLNQNEGNFDWYAEDYEGFIVGVFEIDFTLAGNTASEKVSGQHTSMEVPFSTIYRSESDWRSNFNELAAQKGHDLTVYTNKSFSGMNIDNYFSSNTIKQPKLGTSGDFRLMTKDGLKTLKNWAGTKFNGKKYDEGIYGVGLELANLKITFGNSTASGSKAAAIGGASGKPFSFYYQPTYFNIRGSVYDTAR